jgi:hypothetical protein
MAIKYLSGVTVDSTVLVVDAANDRVGIGTTAPAQKLNVKGSAGNGIALTHSNNNIIAELIEFSGTQGAGLVLKNSSATNNIVLNAGGDSYINGGNVGIGTTAPLSITNNSGLQVDRGGHTTIMLGNGTTTGGVVQSSDDTRRVFIGANIYDDVTNSWSQFDGNAGYAAFDVIGGATNGLARILVGNPGDSSYESDNIFFEAFKSDATSYVKMRTATDDVLYLSNGGNVGIGTTSPGVKLTVQSGINTSSSTVISLLQTTNGAEKAAAGLGLSILNGGESTNAADLWFTTASGGSTSERMRITSAGNVGIGTTSPNTILELGLANLSNPTNNQFLRVNAGKYNEASTSNLDLFNWGNNFGQPLGWRISSATDSVGISVGRFLSFSTVVTDGGGNISTASERMRVTSAGNVGIGTTSPSSILTVLKTITTNFGAKGNAALSLGTAGSQGEANLINFGYDAESWQPAYMGYLCTSGAGSSNGALVFATRDVTTNTQPTERMRITSAGNVLLSGEKVLGINTADGSDTSYLAIAGASEDGTTRGGHIYLSGNERTVDAGSIVLAAGTTSTGTGATGAIVFRTSGSDVARITSGGNVGIGFTDPIDKLQVNGGVTFGGAGSANDRSRIFESSGLTIESGAAGRPIILSTNLTERMRITSAGNVGIGTTSPASTNLVGSVTIYKSYNGDTASVPSTTAQNYYENQSGLYLFGRNSGLTIVGANGENNEIVFANASSKAYAKIGTTNGTTSAGGDMYFNTGGNVEAMRITSAGNVGIGLTNPVQPLQLGRVSVIAQDINSMYIGANFGSGTGGNYIISQFANQIHFDSATGAINFKVAGTGTAGNAISYTTAITILSGGNVGIGTTSPARTLQVEVGSTAQGGQNWSHSNGTVFARLGIVNPGVNNNTEFGSASNNDLVLLTVNAEKMRITAAGNVGIGTTAPDEKLHVDGSTLITYNNSFQSTNSVGNKAMLARVSPTSGIVNYAEYATATNLNGFVIGSDDARVKGNITGDSLEFITNTSTRMTVLSSGNVGINTTVPGSTLHVVGDVLIQTGALGVGVNPDPTDGRIDAGNDIVAFSSSDKRLKENITPIANALEKVRSLTGVEFDWKEETKKAHGHSGRDTGVIAQEVQAIMPTAVRTNNTGYLAVRYEKLIGLLIEGMKEQQAQIDELKAQINDSSR